MALAPCVDRNGKTCQLQKDGKEHWKDICVEKRISGNNIRQTTPGWVMKNHSKMLPHSVDEIEGAIHKLLSKITFMQ